MNDNELSRPESNVKSYTVTENVISFGEKE